MDGWRRKRGGARDLHCAIPKRTTDMHPGNSQCQPPIQPGAQHIACPNLCRPEYPAALNTSQLSALMLHKLCEKWHFVTDLSSKMRTQEGDTNDNGHQHLLLLRVCLIQLVSEAGFTAD